MQKSKRMIALAITLFLMAQLAAPYFALAANSDSGQEQAQIPGMDVFFVDDALVSSPFTDVKKGKWYYSAIAYVYSVGLMSGVSAKTFMPNKAITVAEAITVAVRIYEKYYGISSQAAEATTPWYAGNVAKGLSYGLFPADWKDFKAEISRERLAYLFANVLPDGELAQINEIQRLADVDQSNPYYEQILKLYRAGILHGNDAKGTFLPKSSATRAEFAVLLQALVNPNKRSTFRLLLGDINVFSVELSDDLTCSFTDVSKGKWYYKPIAIQESLGIMNGMGNNKFVPGGTVSVAQALKVAVDVYEKYYGFPVEVHTGQWYDYYVEKALQYKILKKPLPDYSVPATRGQVVSYLYWSMDPEEFSQINPVYNLPDVSPSNSYFKETTAFYGAGILSGSDAKGTAKLGSKIARSELAAILTRLVLPSQRVHYGGKWQDPVQTIQYGTSGSGKYPLEAYRLGEGSNVIVLTFAVHGWEDNFSRDGSELVYLADHLNDYLRRHFSVVEKGNWTVYILRCVNPDGLYGGYTHNGPGRCTTTYYNENGTISSAHGIDINRSFPYNFSAFYNSRNYTGGSPLACAEAKALARFVSGAKGTGYNVCIDTHGWFDQTITSSGYGAIYQAFHINFPTSSYASLYGASGYFSSWAAFSQGYDSCLFELPDGIYSHASFISSGIVDKYTNSIVYLLTNYRGPYSTRGNGAAAMVPSDPGEILGD